MARMSLLDAELRMGPRMPDSFQRQYLRSYAGATANVPINLGWLAAGGWSTSALFRGVESVVATLVDQHIPARLRSIRPVAEWVSTRATISSLVRPQDAVRESLRRLFLDTLHSSVCEELEGLDVTATRTAIAEHSAGRRDRSLDLLPIFQIALGRQVLRQLVKNMRNAYRSSIDSAAPLT